MENKKIELTNWRGTELVDVEVYAQRKLDGNDYGLGQIEATQTTLQNVVKSYARLLQVLHNKNKLTQNDIEEIV